MQWWTRGAGVAMGAGWALVLVGCGGDDARDGEPAAELELTLIVAESMVEVQAHANGSCREATAVPERGSCETFGWALLGVESSSTTDLCRPEPTCVSEIRLERDGETVLSAAGPSVGFFTPIDDDMKVVIEGCGAPIAVELPEPLDDAEASFSLRGDEVSITSSASVDSAIVRARGVPSYPREYIATCWDEPDDVALPLSDDFGTYALEVLLLGEAVTQGRDDLRVFPAVRLEGLSSSGADVGAAWDAAVELAKLSPDYEAYEAYCRDYANECAVEVDTEACATTFVGTAALNPSCSDEFDQLMQCSRGGFCSLAAVSSYAEDPARRAQSNDDLCSAEQQAYDACVESRGN